MSQKAEIKFEFTGNIAAFVKELKSNFNDLNVQVNQVDSTSSTTFGNMQKQIERINFVAITQSIQNLRNTLKQVTGPALSFEQNVADLSAITGLAGEDLDRLSKTARKVGVESGLGAGQAVEAFKLLASQISVDNIGIEGLEVLQQETIKLAQASGMDLPGAASAMASAINQFGLEAGEASRVINVLAAGSKYGAAEIPQLAETFKVAGATASAAGIKIEGLAGIAEVLSQNAITGSEAGTHLRNIIVRMQTQLGMDLSKVPLSDALKSLQPELNNTEFLVKTFGESSIGAVQYLIANADAVESMTAKVTDTQVATEQAAIRTDTYTNSLSRIHAWFDDLKISAFEYTGALLPLVEVTAGFAQGVSSVVPALKLMGGWLNTLRKSKIALAAWTKIVTATQWLWNAAMSANPIGIIILAVGALVGAIVWLTGNIQTVVGWIVGVWEVVRDFFVGIGHAVLDFIDGIIPGFKERFIQFREWLTGWIKRITDTIAGWWNSIKSFLGFGKKETIEIEAELKYPDEMEDQGYSTEAVVEPRRQFGFEAEPPTLARGGRGISESLNQVSGSSAGSQVRNNNISIENLVRDINIHHNGNMPALMEKIRAAVAEALIGAVRDTELAIS